MPEVHPSLYMSDVRRVFGDVFRPVSYPDFTTAARDVWREMVIPRAPPPYQRRPLQERAIVADRDGLDEIEMRWTVRQSGMRWRIRLRRGDDGRVHPVIS